MPHEGAPMIIDLDSHLREECFLDEVYRLDGPYATFTPRRERRARAMKEGGCA